MRKSFTLLFPIVLLLTVSAGTPCFSIQLSSIRDALHCIELGSYDDAAVLVEQACILDETDKLGHEMLGVIYMHTGNLSQSSQEFGKALKITPDDWHIHYALAMIAMAQQRLSEAEKHLQSAARCPEAQDEIGLVRSYLDVLAKRRPSTEVAQLPDSRLATQIRAMEAVRLGNDEISLSALSSLIQGPPPRGFEEKRSPLASFDSKRPVELPAGKLAWKPSGRRDVTTVSGTVALKADTGSADGLSFVTFYVDGEFAAVTNNEPFQYNWNTRNHANGMHEIRIEARDRSGNVASSKTVWVRVSNADSHVEPITDREARAGITQRLWECIRLSESRKLAHYHLADLHLKAGHKDLASEHLQYVVAYQPDFLDAQKRLNELRGSETQYTEFRNGPSGLKRIAITFDDGPNERTVETLALLSSLGVPATFFVVGFRAEAQPELMTAIMAGGHDIENHSYTHQTLPALPAREVELELAKTAAIIRYMTSRDSEYFRPPGGHVSDSVRQAAARLGLKSVLWTVLCSPFEAGSRESLVSHVVNNASDGGIILMHNGEPVTNSALPSIVRTLKARGFEFVTISTLLSKAD